MTGYAKVSWRGNHQGLDQATAGNENNDRQSGLRRRPEPGTWIAAYAAMTGSGRNDGWGGNDGGGLFSEQ